jgi:uncharacterized delta-60 repeat protein
VEAYRATAPAERPEALAVGVPLARARRAALRALIETDPLTALSLAIPETDRAELPAEIIDVLETPVSGAGRLRVLGVMPIPGGPRPLHPVVRTIKLDGQTYFVSASPTAVLRPTTGPAAVQGIAIDGALAIADTPPPGITLPQAAFGDPSFGSDATTGKPLPAYTQGPKKVIIIRVSYTDLPGEPVLATSPSTVITPAYVSNLFNQPNGIADFYAQNSYGATSLVISQSDVTPAYQMPHTAAYYAQGNGTFPYSGDLQEDAVNAAITGGYNISQYDRIGVVTSYLSSLPNSKVSFAGVAEIGGPDFLINGSFTFPIVAHEMGHTYGVYHANWWDPANGTTVGTETDMLYNLFNGAVERVSKEYGDDYDIMSDGSTNIANHFNPWFKSILGWLPNSAVQTVLTSGTYRVYRYDHANADVANHALALKVDRDILRNYWIGYRRQPVGGNINNGAYITYGYFVNRASDLLVCNNPGVNVNQAALQVGQSLVDAGAGVTITTLAQGGSGVDEYLDIGITLAPRVSFQSPTATAELPAATTATILVDRLGGTTGTTTVAYQTINQTAIAGTHYTATSGTLTWLDGDSTPKPIVVPLIPYPTAGGAVDFTIQLTNVTNGVLINPSTITVSLRPSGNPDPNYLADATNEAVLSVALTPDGKQLIAGKFTLVGMRAPISAGRYARLLPDGKRDYTFDCKVGADGEVDAICAQPDGKVLIGGAFGNVNNASPARPKLARLLADGSLDTTFSPPTLDGKVLCLAVQPDGKIVVGGYFKNVAGQPCLGLCRLLPTGAVDFRFNDPSYALDLSGLSGEVAVRAVILDSFSAGSGVRIIAAGSIYQPANSSSYRTGVVRLFANGSVDSSFNIGSGAHERSAPTSRSPADSLALQADGKLLVGGRFTAFGTLNQKYLVRLNSDGSPDPTFAPGITGAPITAVSCLSPQPDGKVVLGGTFKKVNGVVNSNLARVAADGSFDSSWDDGTLSANGSTAPVSALVLRPDGRLIVAISSIASPLLNFFIRGATGPFEYTNVAGGISTQTLFTGLTSRNGVAQFAGANGAVKPGLNFSINVQRVGGSAGAVSVDYSAQDGTALVGVDYQVTRGTLTWADGDTTSKTISLSAFAGGTVGRKFFLNLGIPRGGLGLGSPASATITLDANAPPGGTVNSFNSGGSEGSFGNTPLTGPAALTFLSNAFGLAPGNSPAPNMPHTTVAGNHLRFVFTRDPAQTDVLYEVQASDDLEHWTTIALSSAGNPTVNLDAAAVSEATAGSRVEVTVDDSQTLNASTQRFLRAKLTK